MVYCKAIDLIKGGIAGDGFGLGTVADSGVLGNQVGSGTGQTRCCIRFGDFLQRAHTTLIGDPGGTTNVA
jgi:hypothetical protein